MRQEWTAEEVPVERVRRAWRSADDMKWAARIDSLFTWEADAEMRTEVAEGSARQHYDVAVEQFGKPRGARIRDLLLAACREQAAGKAGNRGIARRVLRSELRLFSHRCG